MSAEPDLSELYALSHNPVTGCRVRYAWDKLDKKRQEVFDAGIVRKDITSVAWMKWLAKYADVRLSSETVRRHRRGDCGCARG